MAVPVLSARSGREASQGPDAKEQGLACPHQTGCMQNREDWEHPLLFTRQRWDRADSRRPLGCGAVRWKLDRRSSRLSWREAWQREKSLWHGGQEPGCDPSQERAAAAAGTVQPFTILLKKALFSLNICLTTALLPRRGALGKPRSGEKRSSKVLKQAQTLSDSEGEQEQQSAGEGEVGHISQRPVELSPAELSQT